MNGRFYPTRPLHVSIEGLPLCGKTRILQILSESPNIKTITNACPVGENVKGVNLIKKFENKESGAAFQLILLNIANFAKRANSHSYRILVGENSLIGTFKTLVKSCENKGEINEIEKTILESLYSVLAGNLIAPPAVSIYVKVPPEVIVQRIVGSGDVRNVEEIVQWITQLHFCYEEWLQLRGIFDPPVIEVNGTLDEISLRREVQTIAEKLYEYL